MLDLTIEIVPALPTHIRIMAKQMKQSDIEISKRFGRNPYKALRQVYRQSLYSKAAFVNGKLVAVWGLLGTYLGEEGRPWSLMSDEITNYPYKVLSFYRKEMQEMLQLFPMLVDMVEIDNTKVLRTLKIMGFTFSEPQPYGKSGDLYIRAEKRL